MATEKRQTLLLVDDDDQVRAALTRTLRRAGFEVLAAPNGPEALVLLMKSQPDIVLSDNQMPGMSGLELLKVVRTRFPDCVRILLTAHADIRTAIEAINQGEIYRFLRKPWNEDELVVTLTLAFEHVELQREHRALLTRARWAASTEQSAQGLISSTSTPPPV